MENRASLGKRISLFLVTLILGLLCSAQALAAEPISVYFSYAGEMSDTFTPGETYVLPECTRVRDGYSFAGWNYRYRAADESGWHSNWGGYCQPGYELALPATRHSWSWKPAGC